MAEKKYIVTALSLGGLNNKVFDSGDIVVQGQLDSPAEKLVEGKFIAPYDTDEEVAPLAALTGDESGTVTPEDSNGDGVPTPSESEGESANLESIPSYEDITKKLIIERLEKGGKVDGKDFKSSDDKKTLYGLLG